VMFPRLLCALLVSLSHAVLAFDASDLADFISTCKGLDCAEIYSETGCSEQKEPAEMAFKICGKAAMVEVVKSTLGKDISVTATVTGVATLPGFAGDVITVAMVTDFGGPVYCTTSEYTMADGLVENELVSLDTCEGALHTRQSAHLAGGAGVLGVLLLAAVAFKMKPSVAPLV